MNIVSRDTVAPPQLPADAPVTDVLQPPEPHGLKLLGDDLKLPGSNRLTRTCSHVITLDPPLGLEDRLDHILASAAQPQSHLIVCSTPEQAFLLQHIHHSHTGLETRLAGEGLSLLIDAPIIIQDVDEFKVVALAGLEVVGVMRWRDLNCARTKSHIHNLCILDDGDAAAIDGMDHKLAVHVGVPGIIWVDSHCSVTQHGLWPGGGNHNLTFPTL
mmetsp:Transcript_7328/g.12632  ORF Transcript_7328/g.12632 Transcript_7328/m.12632 type:complete len:215 (+) Transcript_7328:2105-2749(+)